MQIYWRMKNVPFDTFNTPALAIPGVAGAHD